jgi:hypothetical protein
MMTLVSFSEPDILKLVRRWRLRAAEHQVAADEIAERNDHQDEELAMHLETARVYRKCAEELMMARTR